MRKYSERLGRLSHEQLQAALDRFELGQLLDVQPTTAGLFGQNLILSAKSGEWVFRGGPHWPWQFDKEKVYADRLHDGTAAPVPWPYLVERSEEIFGWSYALMARLPGATPTAMWDGLSKSECCAVGRAIGAGLAESHRLKTRQVGEYDPGGGGILAEPSFSDWVLRTMSDLRTEGLCIPGALEDEDLALLDDLLATHRNALDEPFEPCFVHYDFKEGNVLIERPASGFRLSGIFDLMTWAYGDGEQDLSRMSASLAARDRDVALHFIAAYREQLPFRPGYAGRFRIYMLMDRLIIWIYGRKNGVWFSEDDRFRKFAREPLSLDSLLDENVPDSTTLSSIH